jgi:hypothetical protein
MFQKPLRVKAGLGIPRYYALGDVWNTPRYVYDDMYIKMFERDPTPFDAKKLFNVEDRDTNRYNNYDQRDLMSKEERAQWSVDLYDFYGKASLRKNPPGEYRMFYRNEDNWGRRNLDFNRMTPEKREELVRVYDQLEREERERGFPTTYQRR